LAVIARESLGELTDYDHFLMSFHGLPERHVQKCDLSGTHCLHKTDCCSAIETVNRYCYRAQSYATARLLAAQLGIGDDRYTVAFQSRLGRTPWIQPYTDIQLEELAKRGVKRLAVLIPSFTADCLETLEEIAIRGDESFRAAGGEELHMVPSLNAHPSWVDALTEMLAEWAVPIRETEPLTAQESS
jgi:ferrochelatase